MQRREILRILEECGAHFMGHFILSSGLHAGTYLQCAQLQQYPDKLEKLCAALADKWRDDGITVVIGPALGGIVLAYELARQLGARGVFMERGADGEFELRRGFRINPDDRVLVAEDVVTTGKSVKEVLAKLTEGGAIIGGVASLICRNKQVDFGTKYRYLVDFDFPAYKPDDCPLCAEGVPTTKPGSRPSQEGV